MFGNSPSSVYVTVLRGPLLPNFSDDPPASRFKVRVARDVRSDLGTPLVSRDFEILQSFVDRVRNFDPGTIWRSA
jgi:hypothetical protein